MAGLQAAELSALGYVRVLGRGGFSSGALKRLTRRYDVL